MWPPTVDEVRAELRIASLSPDAAAVLQTSLDAAVSYAEDNRPDRFEGEPAAFIETARIHKGTVRHAGRLYTRASNQPGIEASTELGTPPTYALDPDIAMLLGVARYRRPAVG